MIPNQRTNKLFLSDCLPQKQPAFFHRFEKVITIHNIDFAYLPGTKDIWAVDFMPIQVSLSKFIRFTYRPDYLSNERYQKSISDTKVICELISIPTSDTNIILDGGNVVNHEDTVIMCDKIFKENQHLEHAELISQLYSLLEVSRIIFIPLQKEDYIGHADGMVRFLDEKTVLVNDYSHEPQFKEALLKPLLAAGLECIFVPYNPYGNKSYLDASGTYINYLQMKDVVVVPTFGLEEDFKVLRLFEELFINVAYLECNDLAKKGGILNCISWNLEV